MIPTSTLQGKSWTAWFDNEGRRWTVGIHLDNEEHLYKSIDQQFFAKFNDMTNLNAKTYFTENGDLKITTANTSVL